jgi:hypothetical protein
LIRANQIPFPGITDCNANDGFGAVAVILPQTRPPAASGQNRMLIYLHPGLHLIEVLVSRNV